MTNAKTVLEFGIRTLFDRRGNPMGRWCIHCNAYVTPDLDKSHVSYCPYAALAASEARVKALEHVRFAAEALLGATNKRWQWTLQETGGMETLTELRAALAVTQTTSGGAVQLAEVEAQRAAAGKKPAGNGPEA